MKTDQVTTKYKQRNRARWSGNNAFVSDFARQDPNITTFLDHLQRTIDQRERRGDLGVRPPQISRN